MNKNTPTRKFTLWVWQGVHNFNDIRILSGIAFSCLFFTSVFLFSRCPAVVGDRIAIGVSFRYHFETIYLDYLFLSFSCYAVTSQMGELAVLPESFFVWRACRQSVVKVREGRSCRRTPKRYRQWRGHTALMQKIRRLRDWKRQGITGHSADFPWDPWRHGGPSSTARIISGILCLPVEISLLTESTWRPWCAIPGMSGMISLSLRRPEQKTSPIPLLKDRSKRWRMWAMGRSAMRTMNGTATCTFWNRRAEYTAESMRRNISTTDFAGSGSDRKKQTESKQETWIKKRTEDNRGKMDRKNG